MNKFLVIAVIGILLIGLGGVGYLYKNELDKSHSLKDESLKTSSDILEENKKLKAEVAKLKETSSSDKRALLNQMSAFSNEKDAALKELENIKKNTLKERELSLVANEDLEVMRKEVAVLRKESSDNIKKLEQSFNKRKQLYETRILSLEAQLDKSKGKFAVESERYHYNLGVVYSQNKDFQSAVSEFKTALSYNPKNYQAHYNLGVIYDDYFKDSENAKYHYRSFLELSPTSDDAESVQEWLSELDK